MEGMDAGSLRGQGQLAGPQPCFEQWCWVHWWLTEGSVLLCQGISGVLAEQDEILGVTGALQRMAAHFFWLIQQFLLACLNQTR